MHSFPECDICLSSSINADSQDDNVQLSILEITLLRQLKQTRNEKELSRMTNVDKKVITEVLDRLWDKDYIGEDSMVTEKGFDLLGEPSIRIREVPPVQLSALELLLLKNVGSSNKDKELSRLANIALETVTAKLDKLYDEDLISKDHMLTEMGFNLLSREASRSAPPPEKNEPLESVKPISAPIAPTRTVVIQREIVKVPCKYCGALNDIATSRKCSNCGAAVK